MNDEIPLMHAAEYGQESLVYSLIEQGVDVNAVDRDGVTALMLAAANNHPAIVSALIIEGANVDLVNHHNQTALQMAILRGHVESPTMTILRDGWLKSLEGIDQKRHQETKRVFSDVKKVLPDVLCKLVSSFDCDPVLEQNPCLSDYNRYQLKKRARRF